MEYALAPPAEGNCSHCGHRYEGSDYVYHSDGSSCTLFLERPHDPLKLPLYELECYHCHSRTKYSGTSDGIFLLSRTQAVALQFLYKGLDFLHSTALAPESFHASLVEDYKGQYYDGPERAIPFFNANTWRNFFFLFLHCINAGLEPGHAAMDFKCQICRDSPKCLIVDGTSIKMNRAYYIGESITQRSGAPCLMQRPHTRNQRSFFDYPRIGVRKELIKEMKSFAALLTNGQVDPARLSLSEVETAATALLQYPTLQQLGSQYGIVEFLEWIHTKVVNRALSMDGKKAFGTFLGKNLATDSPVSAYLPPQLALAIHSDLDTHGDILRAETVKLAAEMAPCLFQVLEVVGASRVRQLSMPDQFKPLLRVLCQRTFACVEGPNIGAEYELDEIDDSRMHATAASTRCLKSGICCGLPQLRHRPLFGADDEQSDARDEERITCHKDFQNGGARTGGVMTVFCEHEICYATFVMEGAESRDHLFSFIVKYLARPPQVLIYDFGCAALDYCLNRLPGWFKDMLVVVDRFHWGNHKACCSSFNMRLYEDVKLVNSQVAEQCNAALKKINPTLHRSSQPLFMAILRQYLRGWNWKKNSKTEEQMRRVRRYNPQVVEVPNDVA